MIDLLRSSRAIFIGLTAILLILFGVGLWVKTNASVAPPIYDPMSYYSKSAYVWKCLSKGRISRVLNGGLSIRPPGTAFVLYPLGFKASVKSFLFRSTFAPLAIWAASLLILMLPLIGKRSDAFLGAALIAALTSIPMFFQFELSDAFSRLYFVTNQWGFVDTLEGTVGALGLALIVTGFARRSLFLSIAGSAVGAFTVFIKPSGILVILALMGIAAVEFAKFYFQEPERRKALWKFAGLHFLAALIVAASVLWVCTHSDYLSKETIATAKAAQNILIEIKKAHALSGLLNSFIEPVFGWWFFVPMVLAALFFTAGACFFFKGSQRVAMAMKLAMAAMIAAASIYWWRTMAGAEHRYLFPFILMLIAWFVPEVFGKLKEAPLALKAGAAVYALIPFGTLAVMLYLPKPDFRVQTWLGVNLTSGQYGKEVKMGQWLIDQAVKQQKTLAIYSMTDSSAAGVIEMMNWMNHIEHNKVPFCFDMHRPNYWASKPGIDIADFLKCDFVLAGEPSRQPPEPITNWEDEVKSFSHGIFSTCGPDQNGLELVDAGQAKIFRVVDRNKLSETILAWARSVQWKNDFYERNRAFLESHK